MESSAFLCTIKSNTKIKLLCVAPKELENLP